MNKIERTKQFLGENKGHKDEWAVLFGVLLSPALCHPIDGVLDSCTIAARIDELKRAMLGYGSSSDGGQ